MHAYKYPRPGLVRRAEELDELEQGVAHRAARLYTFNKKRYRQLHKEGAAFEIA